MLASCSQNKLVDEFADWRNDTTACKIDRAKFNEHVTLNKDQLIGLNQQELLSILGQPDKKELIDKGLSFLIYDIKGGKKCQTTHASEKLYIRIGALGMVRELQIRIEID